MKAFFQRLGERIDAMDPYTRQILGYTLAGIAFLTALFGILAIPSFNSFRNCDPAFSYGEIQDGGSVVPGEFGIYTKKLIECTAFDITLDLGVQDTVKVHYYDADGNWLASDLLTGGVLLSKSYDDMYIAVGEEKVKIAGIRLSAKRDGTSITGAERLTYAWQFDLSISTSKPDEYSKARPDFVLGEVSDTGVFDTYVAFRERSMVTKSIIPCTAFDLVFDEPAKYIVMIHYYRLDQWLSCEQLPSSGALAKSYEDMAGMGATGIRLSVSRDDNRLLDLDDYFTPFTGTFSSHVTLEVSQLHKFPVYSEAVPELSYGRLLTSSGVMDTAYDEKHISTKAPVRCLSFSIQLDDGGKYDVTAYYYRLDEVSNSFVLVGSDKAGADGVLTKSEADMAALGADAVAFTFSRDDGQNFDQFIDCSWFNVQNFTDHFTLTVYR